MKLNVEQTHEAYVITIPSVEVWTDPFLMMTVKLLERYDPAEERAEHRKAVADLASSGSPVFAPSPETEQENTR